MNRHTFDADHTPSDPYCDKDPRDCWCHTDSNYHSEVEHPEKRTTEQDVAVARSFFGLSSETHWGGAR